MVTKADKRNSIVITYQREYNKKALEFINNNNFATLNKDPTTAYQNEIRKTITNCTTVIPKNNTWKLLNMHPSPPPQFHGQTKVYKTNMPIRPVINWKQTPAYKLAQYLVHILNTHIPLPNAFNIKKNSMHLMNDLTQIPYNNHLRTASLHINNTYANIPTNELIPLIATLCSWYNIAKEKNRRSSN
jgi:hypothetical protein